MATAFGIETPLISVEESVRLCPGSGFDGNEECGNELDPHEVELCPNCEAFEERVYQARRIARDREEEILGRSQYSHLRGQR